MQDLNDFKVIGRLTQDVGADERSFQYIGNGTAKANVSIAVNSAKKDGDKWVDEVSFFTITIFGKTAENLKPYLTKGQQVLIEGMLKQDRWQDKYTGNNMSKIYINAISVRLVGGKRDNNGQQNNGYNGFNSANGQNYQNQKPQDNGYQNGGEMYGNDFPEDIPF